MSSKDDCRICAIAQSVSSVPVLYRDDLWLVRHSGSPFGVAGWLTFQTIRHVAEPADFNDAEAASMGLLIRGFEGILRDITKALRIYTVAMSESVPHFHGHMVPRYEVTPGDVSGFALFDLSRLAASGAIQVDEAEVGRISEAFRHRAASGFAQSTTKET